MHMQALTHNTKAWKKNLSAIICITRLLIKIKNKN